MAHVNYTQHLLAAAKKYAWWLGLFFVAVHVGLCFTLRGTMLLYRLVGLSAVLGIILAFAYKQYKKEQGCTRLSRIFMAKLSRALPWNGGIFFAQLLYAAFFVASGQVARYQLGMAAVIVGAVLVTALWNYFRQRQGDLDECVSANDAVYLPDHETPARPYLNYIKHGLLFVLAFLGADAFYEYTLLSFYGYESVVFYITEVLIFVPFVCFFVLPFMARMLQLADRRITKYFTQAPGSYVFYLKRHFYSYLICLGVYDVCISLIALAYQPSLLGYIKSFETTDLQGLGAYSLSQKLTISAHFFSSWFFVTTFCLVVVAGSFLRWAWLGTRFFFGKAVHDNAKNEKAQE